MGPGCFGAAAPSRQFLHCVKPRSLCLKQLRAKHSAETLAAQPVKNRQEGLLGVARVGRQEAKAQRSDLKAALRGSEGPAARVLGAVWRRCGAAQPCYGLPFDKQAAAPLALGRDRAYLFLHASWGRPLPGLDPYAVEPPCCAYPLCLLDPCVLHATRVA